MRSNLKKHEFIGLLMIFLAGALLALGFYLINWAANRPLYYSSLSYMIKSYELIFVMVIFGVAFVLWSLGQVELKEAMPGSKRK